jgi:pilus assembly protein Flp/PilA
MGQASRLDAIRDAACRSAPCRNASRFAVGAFVRNADGATSIEYALIAGLISILIIAGVTQIGTTVRDAFFNKIAANI